MLWPHQINHLFPLKKKELISLIDESINTYDDNDIGDIDAVSRNFIVVKRIFECSLLLYPHKNSWRMGWECTLVKDNRGRSKRKIWDTISDPNNTL